MDLPRPRTFSHRLLAFTTVSVGLAVTLVCGTLALHEVVEVRARASDLAATQAHLAALALGGSAATADAEATRNTLRPLLALEGSAGLAVVAHSGEELASVSRSERVADLLGETLRYRSDRVVGAPGGLLLASVPLPGPAAGGGGASLRYAFDPAALRSDLLGGLALCLAAGVLAWSVAMLLAWKLKRNLVAPVAELNGVARRVRDESDYRLRAIRFADDELGELTDTFNEMLARVEAADEDLQKSRRRLEARVAGATAELTEALGEARAASVAKSRFLANMSHEIRTPMTAILGYSHMLRDPEQTAEERLDCIETVCRNGNHLLGIVNDILDVSKIEAGAMTVERLDTPLIQLVADVASVTRIQALEKGIGFRVAFEGAVPDRIVTDPTRFRQVLINLVGNAVKFTRTGGVEVRTSFEGAAHAGGGQLRIEVRDTGIGMTPEQVDRLFRAFTQADDSTSRRFGGSGLGLVIARELAVMLGGDVSVESEAGRGSCFRVDLEVELPAGAGCARGSPRRRSRRWRRTPSPPTRRPSKSGRRRACGSCSARTARTTGASSAASSAGPGRRWSSPRTGPSASTRRRPPTGPASPSASS